jgi:hydrogenase expression/formation protein HypC
MCLAIPGKVIDVQERSEFERTGRVEFGGVVREVNLALVPEAGVGDFVLVHVGIALSKVDEAEARQVFAYLQQLGEVDDGEAVVEESRAISG